MNFLLQFEVVPPCWGGRRNGLIVSQNEDGALEFKAAKVDFQHPAGQQIRP
jgi:hypothetical protein